MGTLNVTVAYLIQTAISSRTLGKRNFLFTKKTQGESSNSSDCVVGLLTHHALLSKDKRSNWIVDSGATCHMCHDVEKFINFRKLDVAEEITLGDGFSVETLGTGTIELNVIIYQMGNTKNAGYMILYMFLKCLTIY